MSGLVHQRKMYLGDFPSLLLRGKNRCTQSKYTLSDLEIITVTESVDVLVMY